MYVYTLQKVFKMSMNFVYLLKFNFLKITQNNLTSCLKNLTTYIILFAIK